MSVLERVYGIKGCARRPASSARGFGLFILAAALIGAGAPAHARKSEAVAPLVDHHIHIQSAAVSDLMHKTIEKNPKSIEGISKDVLEPRTGEDAVRQLDRAGIKQGVLLSTGYMFASPMLQVEPAEAARLMHEENQYNVDAARASHGRLIAFVGINPLAANAAAELAYWSKQPDAAGIKLHLGNSQFDYASTEQMEKLATFVRAASAAKMPLVIHSRSSSGFTPENIRRFIDTVVSQAGDIPVQIAHGGGYGGVDQATVDALAIYGEAIARKAPGTQHLVFDISAVAQFDLGESPDNRRRYIQDYVALMRKIGLDRFVLGSDWPGLHPPAEYFAIEKAELPVNSLEWQRLCRNRAPYLLPAWKRAKSTH